MSGMRNERHLPTTVGVRLQRYVEAIETRAAEGSARSVVLGSALGIATVAIGIGLFLLVWFVFVELLH
jgi:hypothetical protein